MQTWIGLGWAVALVLALGLKVPFGIPGEWVWSERMDISFDPVTVIASILTLIALSGLAWVVSKSSSQDDKRFRLMFALLLALAIAFRALIAVMVPRSWMPVPVFWTLVIASPVATSFYDEARNLEQQGLVNYLRHYHEQLPQKQFHAATHPPGLPMLFAVLRGLAMSPTLQALTPIDKNSLIAIREVHMRIAPPMQSDLAYPSDAEFKAAWWIAMFCLLCGIITFLVWGGLLCQVGSNPAIIAFAATTPAMLWWQTTVDNIHLLATTLTCAFAYRWLQTRKLCWAVLTGLMAGLSLWLAFKNAILIACIALWLLWENIRSKERLSILQAILVLVLTLSPYLLAWLAFGFQPVETFKAASASHHAQAGAHARSYLPWVFVNFADFGMALGGAWLGLVAVNFWVWLRQRQWQPSILVTTLVVLILLDLSGLVRGEVARLWMPFIPLLTFGSVKHVPQNPLDFALLTFVQGGVALALQVQLEFLRPF